jgi:two-component system cell cycle sensor histidine kinase/response regulator CckA
MISLANSPQPARLEAELAELRGRVAALEAERLALLEQQRHNDSRYKQLFEAIPESVLVIGTDGRVVAANPASAVLYGFESPEQLEGHPTPLLIAEKDRNSTARRYTQVRRDGSEFIAEVTSTTLRGPGQQVSGSIEIARDITKLATAERLLFESEKNYRGIFDNATEGIFQTTKEGLFIRTNPALTAMLGYESAEEMIAATNGLSSNLYFRPEDRSSLVALYWREMGA